MKKAWEIAQDWYNIDECVDRIQKANSSLSTGERIPEDIHSRDFAIWLTREFKCAMAKGVQLGRQDQDQVVIETVEDDISVHPIIQIRLTETQENEIMDQIEVARQKDTRPKVAIVFPSRPDRPQCL